MFAANPTFNFGRVSRPCSVAQRNQHTHAFHVQRLERVGREDPGFSFRPRSRAKNRPASSRESPMVRLWSDRSCQRRKTPRLRQSRQPTTAARGNSIIVPTRYGSFTPAFLIKSSATRRVACSRIASSFLSKPAECIISGNTFNSAPVAFDGRFNNRSNLQSPEFPDR